MNYLIDTHTLIWAITDTSKLFKKVMDLLVSEENSIYVSSICFWEIALKFSLGKLELKGVGPSQMPELAKQHGFEFLPLIPEDAATYNHLPSTSHRDPFDRMLVWQAIRQNLIVVTKDPKFENYKDLGLKVVW